MADTPETTPQASVTPSQAGAATAAAVVADQQAAAEKRLADSLDIRDPGQRAPARTTEQGQERTPERKGVDGAVADGGLTPDLLARAKAIGIEAEEARDIKPQTLERMIERYEREPVEQPTQPQVDPNYLAWLQQQRQAQQQVPEFQPILPPSLDPNVFEEAAVQAQEQVRYTLYQQQLAAWQREQALMAQMGQIQNHLAQANQRAQAEQSRRDFDSFEAVIGKDKEYEDVFGSGPASALVGTPQYENRRQVAVRAQSIHDEYVRQGLRPPAVEKLYEQARNSIHGARAPKLTPTLARNEKGQFLGRTTATTRSNSWESMPHGAERAESAVAELLANGPSRN